jgi:hypothetical protein
MRSSCCLHVCMYEYIPPFNFSMPEPIFMKLGTYIMAPEPISTAYFLNPAHQSVCLCVYPSIVIRKRLGKNVTMTTNTHAKMAELLDMLFSVRSVKHQRRELLEASFSMWSVSSQMKVGD